MANDFSDKSPKDAATRKLQTPAGAGQEPDVNHPLGALVLAAAPPRSPKIPIRFPRILKGPPLKKKNTRLVFVLGGAFIVLDQKYPKTTPT